MNEEILHLDKQLCFRLYAVSRNMTRLYKPLLDKFNLTYPQYIVLLVLFEEKKIDFKDLSNIVDLKTGTLSPILTNLQKKGYLEKIPNPKDKRNLFLELTKKGEQLNKDILSVPVDLYNKIQITPDMYNVLVKELDDLKKILEAAEIKEK